MDGFILLMSTLHRVDIEAIGFLCCGNNLNSIYEAAKTGFDVLLQKMRLFWLHFGFGLVTRVEVALTKSLSVDFRPTLWRLLMGKIKAIQSSNSEKRLISPAPFVKASTSMKK